MEHHDVSAILDKFKDLGADELAEFAATTNRGLRLTLTNLIPAWLYLARLCSCPTTTGRAIVPAMLVAAIAGRACSTKDDQKNFVRNVLRVYGSEGQDWKFLTRNEVFRGPFTVETENGSDVKLVKFNVPNRADCMLVFRSSCGPATKFPFVTPYFAQELLMKMPSSIRGDVVDLYIEIAQRVQVYLDEKQQQQQQQQQPEVTDSVQVDFAKSRLQTAQSTMATKLTLMRGGNFCQVHRCVNESVMGINKNELQNRIGKKPGCIKDYMSQAQMSVAAGMLGALAQFETSEEMTREALALTEEFKETRLGQLLHFKEDETPQHGMSVYRAKKIAKTQALVERPQSPK
eukprot:CAMPEP_0171500586 /NCGR_PEP_ID=MMETSP0958-20121227/9069_1 /TAXON_ID=87120 /ORGANISM="Aurantiochytrium limacinum, Strain ATCCMYA-1381" /LENGTH=345 /DNA_ID=CAMNT_0012035275 /DNA_START=130 /DNA_END=1167 /DNA_ORIENTATION=+